MDLINRSPPILLRQEDLFYKVLSSICVLHLFAEVTFSEIKRVVVA